MDAKRMRFFKQLMNAAGGRMEELGAESRPEEVYPIASMMNQYLAGPLPGSPEWQRNPQSMGKPGSGSAERLHMVNTRSMGGPEGAGMIEGAFAETPLGRQIAANRNIEDVKMFASGVKGTWEEAWQRGLSDYAQSGDWMSAYGMGY